MYTRTHKRDSFSMRTTCVLLSSLIDCHYHYSYHADCLDRWLRVSELCPLCKTSVLPQSDSTPAPIATTSSQSADNAESSPRLSDPGDAEEGRLPLSNGVPSSPSPSTSQSPSLEDIPATDATPPATSLQSQSSHTSQASSSHRPRHLSSGELTGSFDGAMELVPVASRRSTVRPSVVPSGREPGPTASGRAAPPEQPLTGSSRRAPRRQQPPRSTRQQQRRAVPAAATATGRR